VSRVEAEESALCPGLPPSELVPAVPSTTAIALSYQTKAMPSRCAFPMAFLADDLTLGNFFQNRCPSALLSPHDVEALDVLRKVIEVKFLCILVVAAINTAAV
jgi:hypothetical protein